MHPQLIVQRFVHTQLHKIHAARQALFVAAVSAVMGGCALSLTRLARGVIERSTLKAALKRVDRLIGNARIEGEAQVIGQALLARLCLSGQPLVIAVDWSSVSPGGQYAELRAVLSWPGMGRGLTVYQQVYGQDRQGSPSAERALLERLRRWIPSAQAVIVVSDAGFRQPWFAQLEAMGWDWIGRVRGGIGLAPAQGAWHTPAQWFAQATGKARAWRDCLLTRQHRFACDAVLVRRRVVGRTQYGRPGHAPNSRRPGRDARSSAREPWLLVCSKGLRAYRPDQIAAIYAQRMHIEENFRDSKSLALGMGLEIARSRSALRLHALLLINTLAAFLLWQIGQLAEAEGLHRRFKATTRPAREISIISLALLLCARSSIPLSTHGLQALRIRIGIQS